MLPDFEPISTSARRARRAIRPARSKPDLVGPSEVTNFAALDRGFTFWETFNGTSAAASHVAGVVALLQSRPPAERAPAVHRRRAQADPARLGDRARRRRPPALAGPDPVYGHGLVQIPAAILPGVPGASTRDDRDGDLRADPAYFDPATGTWKWLTSTAGETTLSAFGGGQLMAAAGDYDGDGRVDAAIYDTDHRRLGVRDHDHPGRAGQRPRRRRLPAGHRRLRRRRQDRPRRPQPGTGDWRWQGSTSGVDEVLAFGGTGLPRRAGRLRRRRQDRRRDLRGGDRRRGRTSGPRRRARRFTSPAARAGSRCPPTTTATARPTPPLFQTKKGKWRFRRRRLGGLSASITGLGGAGWIPVPGRLRRRRQGRRRRLPQVERPLALGRLRRRSHGQRPRLRRRGRHAGGRAAGPETRARRSRPQRRRRGPTFRFIEPALAGAVSPLTPGASTRRVTASWTVA